MNSRNKGSLLLLLGSLIWGTAFVFQAEGMQYLQPLTFQTIRFYIGCIVLLPFMLRSIKKEKNKKNNINAIKGGIICGIFLFLAASFQQFGLLKTPAGKAGFITALYLLIVPIISLFLYKKKISIKTAFALLLAMLGFYLLCIKGKMEIATSDILLLFCAFFFAWQILAVDRYSKYDAYIITFFEFLTAAIISNIGMLALDTPNLLDIKNAWFSLFYVGAISGGFGYTLQVVGQKNCEPTLASLLMSLESVFATLAEWLILHTTMNPTELLGCLLVFMAVIIVQVYGNANTNS